MSVGKQPKVSQMLENALSLQGANILQKNTLDMMATKLVLVLKALEPVKHQSQHLTTGEITLEGTGEYWDVKLAEDALNAISKALNLTRDEAREARSVMTPDYPNERIQAIITKATDEITAILLEHGQG